MIKAVNECYSYEYANIHRGIYELSSKLTKRYEDSRASVSKFINSPSSENIIFTKSATEGINLVSSCLSEDYFNDGDEVLLTSLEHHANLVPWHLVSKKIKIITAKIDNFKEAEIDVLQGIADHWRAKKNHKTVFISAVSKENINQLKALIYEMVKTIHIKRFPYQSTYFNF